MPTNRKIHREALDCKRRIHKEFRELLKLVYGGHELAAQCLHDTLRTQIKKFHNICNTMPELFGPIASKATDWPGYITADDQTARRNARLAVKLRLGTAAVTGGNRLPSWKFYRQLEQIDNQVEGRSKKNT